MDKGVQAIDLDFLYREYFTPIFRYIYFKTHNYDLSQDIAQSTFLKYIKQNNVVNDIDHARRLLYIIAKNLLIDTWRKKGGDNISIEDSYDVPDTNMNQEVEAIKRDDIEYLKTVLSDLDETEQEIIGMRVTLELDYRAISDELNISEVNARKIYSRALQKVGVVLKESGRF